MRVDIDKLEAMEKADHEPGETPFQVEQRFHAMAHAAWHNSARALSGEGSNQND